MAFLITSVISFLILCSTFNICQFSSNQSVHLTGGGGGFKEVQLYTLAPCHANNGSKQTANMLFEIEFRLPREGGICDEGLLICYPALLQRGNHLDKSRNFKVARKYIVDANEGNSIVRECVQKMPKNGNKNGTIIWRGLKLRTVPMLKYQSNGSIIILEASISSRKRYILNVGQRKFYIIFGWNQITEPFTRFSLEENDLNGPAIQNEFVRANGPSFLSDYAGLWLLGLDMLPMAHQTEQKKQLKMELFINRSCNCSMEAWFVQPSHSVGPSDPKVPFVGSACKPNPTEEEYGRSVLPHCTELENLMGGSRFTRTVKNVQQTIME